MKKLLTLLLILTLLLAPGVTASAGSAVKTVDITYRGIRIVVNGTEIVPTDAAGKRVEPFILNGSTYLPVRAVAGALGLDVGWDAATSTVTLTSGAEPSYGSESPTLSLMETHRVTVTYRDIKIVIDGETVIPTDATGAVVEPFILDGTTYLPVRAVAGALGAEVGWDAATSTVSLSAEGASPPATEEEKPQEVTYLLTKETYLYTYASEHSSMSSTATATYTYNEKGWLTGCTATGEGTALSYVLSYDDAGNIVKAVSGDATYDMSYDAKGNLTRTVTTTSYGVTVNEFAYDDAGNVIKESYTDEVNGSFTITYTYEDGLCVSEVSEGKGDGYHYVNRTATEYDSHGNVTRETYSYIDRISGYSSESVTTCVNSYDSHGSLTRVKGTSDSFAWTESYTYDSRGQLLSEVYADNDECSYRSDYTYDAQGNILTHVHTANEYGDSYGFSYTYTYDADGNILTESYNADGYSYDEESYSYTLTYTYDEHGNVVKLETVDPAEGYTAVVTYEYMAFPAA